MEMDTYVANLKQAKRRMEKEGAGSKLSDKAFGVRMLRQSGLLPEEKRQVLASTSSNYAADKIEESLRNLFRDAARTDKSRMAAMHRHKEAGKGASRGKHIKGSKGEGKGGRGPPPPRTSGYGTFVASEASQCDGEEDFQDWLDDTEAFLGVLELQSMNSRK